MKRTIGTGKSEQGAKASARIFTLAIALLMVSVCFSVPMSQEAQALDFVETLAVPWTSTFTPLDSAWDANGTQCVVVGNETNGIDPSAWLYNDPSSSWFPIYKGTDPSAKVNKRVYNDDTGIIYGSIQLAINNATAGQTIRLWSGTYNETLTISKPLTIEGNGSANTIIDGRNLNTVIRVTSNWVNISGFKVTGGPAYTGILLYKVNNCKIQNCSVEGNGDGIVISGSSNNIVKNNYVQNNAGVGVKTQESETTKHLVGISENSGLLNYGAMYRADLSGANYSITHNFHNGMAEGYPYTTPFIQDSSDVNKLYSTTDSGGKYNRGTLFTVRKDGTQFKILHNFTQTEGAGPQGLVQSGTYLYSTTTWGGITDGGTLFRINKDGTNLTTLFNFPTGSYAVGTMVLSGGTTFYGMTTYGGANGVGSIYKINIDGTGYALLYSFFSATSGGGRNPYGSLTFDPTLNILYGMTYRGSIAPSTTDGGVIFKYWIANSTYKPMHSFTDASTGKWPRGGLLRSGTILYGMTSQGGTYNSGTLFRINTDGTSMAVLRHFDTPDGTIPYGNVVTDGTYLYGFTSQSGPMAGNYGTVFRWSISLSSYSILYSFTATPDGQYPRTTPLLYSGFLYGLCNGGGNFGGGTTFSITTTGTNYFTFHHFNTNTINTNYPTGKVVQSGNYLYGMTTEGGYDDSGMIYRTNLDGTGLVNLREFIYDLGGSVWGNTLFAEGNYLYGLASGGGVNYDGVIFRINNDGTGYVMLGEFESSVTGSGPVGELLKIGSTFYGVCGWGGTSGRGTIFKINTDGTGFNAIYHFTGGVTGGDRPVGGLDYDGTYLYGMTQNGGSTNRGILYRITTAGGATFNILKHFTGAPSDGSYPSGKLLLDGSDLYGMTDSGGTNDRGIVFKCTTSGTFTILKHFNSTIGTYLYSGLTLDGSMLYGMTHTNGMYGYGTLFRLNKDTMAFTTLRHFQGPPNDGGNPGNGGVTVVQYPAQSSSANLIYHNNFIGNVQQAYSDNANNWNAPLPEGGNYWSDYTGNDIPADGIGDTMYLIEPLPVGNADLFPWMARDGWALPYTTFTSVDWDSVHQRFWICGEMAAGPLGEFYYIPLAAPTTMVPIMAPAMTFTALAADELGNVLIGGNDLSAIFYYSVANNNGYSIVENGTGSMLGYDINGITFNSFDNRFYFVGNVKNMDVGVAFFTDPLPLNQSGRKCYIDTSDFINNPGIGGLKSIAWNPTRNYSIAVGDGVYRLMPYNGNPARELTWATVKAPSAGTSYSDVSWDRNGWNEAAVVGQNGTYGSYWRYYHTNQKLIVGNQSSVAGTVYRTCAMKPPSSPKWLLIPHSGGAIRVNIQEKDESGTVSFAANKPQIFSVDVWKRSDTLQLNLLNQQVDSDSTYTFCIIGNYTVGGIDMWGSLRVNITAWFDGGAVGLASQPNDPAWSNNNSRTRQFRLTYYASLNFATIQYPTASPFPAQIREFNISGWWRDPFPYGSDGNTHRVLINVTFKKQTWAADGDGFVNGPAAGGAVWDKLSAFNDPNSWDMEIHMYDVGNVSMFNTSYEEFGIKEFASISSSGTPTGSAPPGHTGLYLGNTTIHYSSNTFYFVTVSIPNLHMNGDPLNPKYIPVTNLYVRNLHNYSDPAYSDIDANTYFVLPNDPLCIWGIENPLPTPIAAPWHGTEAAGPMYTDYQASALGQTFEVTRISWWIDVPVSVAAGVYLGTITITVSDTL